MEGDTLIIIPFSKVLATMLLMKENDNWFVKNSELINFDSMISSSNKDIEVSTEDDYDYFECCVEHDDKYNFSIKRGFTYDTLLDNGLTVREFLKSNSLSEEFLKILLKDYNYMDNYSVNELNDKVVKDKKRRLKKIIRPKDKDCN